MEKAKKIKIFIGLFYLIVVCLFLYFFFSKFSIQEITSYEFIKNNRDYFFELKTNQTQSYLRDYLFCFVYFGRLAGGFGSPIIIFAGFIFGNWFGTLLLIIGMTIGATSTLYFCKLFFKRFN